MSMDSNSSSLLSPRYLSRSLETADDIESEQPTHEMLKMIGPCPSTKCWTFVDGVCEPNPNANCFSLQCNPADITITFEEDLFGVDRFHVELFNTIKCSPTWTGNTWTIISELGECDQQIGFQEFNVESTSKPVGHVTIDWNITPAGDYHQMGQYEIIQSAIASLSIQCRYPTDIQLNSNPYGVQATALHGQTIGYGEFSGGFDLTFYRDQAFTQEINISERIFIGRPIYTKIKWSVSSLKDDIDFYVRDCDVTTMGSVIPIIKENCYSDILRAQLLNPDDHHVQSNESMFKFKTFAVKSDHSSSSYIMSCKVRMCSKAVGNCHINPICQPSGYQYSLFGHM